MKVGYEPCARSLSGAELVFEGERNPAADALLDRVADQGAIVPTLWRLEIANGFQTAIRRKRIDSAFRDAALAALSALAITVDSETDAHAWSTTLRLSDQFRLTVYDATYLELAQRRSLPLASFDAALRRAGAALGLTLLGGEA